VQPLIDQSNRTGAPGEFLGTNVIKLFCPLYAFEQLAGMRKSFKSLSDAFSSEIILCFSNW